MLYLAQSLVIPFGIAIGFAGVMTRDRGRALAAFGIAVAYLAADVMLRGLPVLPPSSALQLTLWVGLLAGGAAIAIERSSRAATGVAASALVALVIGAGFPFSAGALALPANELMMRIMMTALAFSLLLQASGAVNPTWAEARPPQSLSLIIGLGGLVAIAHLYGSRISLHGAIVLAAVAGHRLTALIGYGPTWSRGAHFTAAGLLCALAAGLFFTRAFLVGPVGLLLIAQIMPDALRQFMAGANGAVERAIGLAVTLALTLMAVRLL